MALDPGKVSELLAALREAHDADGIRVEAARILNFLLRQLEELRGLANGYPNNSISAAVWMDGAELTRACDALADELAKYGLPNEEELTSRLAVGMAFQVMGHYPEEIFPRVVRNARCRERIGERELAEGCYDGVVADFRELGLDHMLEDDAEPLGSSGHIILDAVIVAAERLSELRPQEKAELAALQKALHDRLGHSSA